MNDLYQLILYYSLLFVPVLGWKSSAFLPRSVRNQKKPIDDNFYKFWRRSVLDGLIKYDYDTWFARFLEFPPSLEATVGTEFNCPAIQSHRQPSSVHRLFPGDINVVASIGDSMTTAFAARSKSVFDLFVEFRGISWSAGGKGKLEEVTTLPNIIKKYNPMISGFSTGMTPVSKRKDNGSGNNFAKSGATAESLSEQVEELISVMKENREISFKKDWKLITVYIGTEDLCLACHDHDLGARHFIKRVSHTLEKIREKIPRVLVNIIQVFDVTKYNALTGSYCQAFLKVSCPCAVGGYRQRALVSRLASQYSSLLKRLVDSPKYRDTQDFAVVLQPFLSHAALPRNSMGRDDYSYFAPDCFHLSAKGQAAMATALWNSMLQPVGLKMNALNFNDKLGCPRPDFPFIFTKTNSKEYLSARPQMNSLKWDELSMNREKVSERESKEKGEVEREAGPQSLAVAIGSGFAVAAVAVAVVIYVIKKRRGNSLLAGEATRNYQTLGDETRL
ncbi:phospholipase B1, membrane-associated-like [Rhopilema esculentum]|uniref:phospholipase B1, membrane-associated-like n=1 Tax=Rhopilema esculentum TaxID=499914 RepID=UPI0031DD9401